MEDSEIQIKRENYLHWALLYHEDYKLQTILLQLVIGIKLKSSWLFQTKVKKRFKLLWLNFEETTSLSRNENKTTAQDWANQTKNMWLATKDTLSRQT